LINFETSLNLYEKPPPSTGAISYQRLLPVGRGAFAVINVLHKTSGGCSRFHL
jgi:hypothetical protein